MLLLAGETFCQDTANIWHLLGSIVVVIKIVIPIILVILGMVDLGKAVVSSDEKAMNKAVGTLIKRFIAALVVFFIPTIVSALFSAAGVITNDGDYQICIQCVTAANSDSGIKSVNGEIHSCEEWSNLAVGNTLK